MGSKYSSQSVSGYNSSAPSDDGSTASTNQVKWATIKTKLGDPLNSFASAVNSALVTAFDYSMRSVTSADSTVAGDHMRTLQVPSTVTTTFTIPLADAATMANGYIVRIRNSSQVGITIGRATSGDTLDGATSNKLLPPGATGIYGVNASANGYVTLAYAGPVQDTDAIVAGGTDGTKKLRFEVDGFTAGTTRVLTAPDYDGTVATLAGTETLTNKTLGATTLGGAVTGNGQNITGLGTVGANAVTISTATRTGASATDICLPNDAFLRGANTTNAASRKLIGFNSGNFVEVGDASSNGTVFGLVNTTASAANAYVDNAANNELKRSTSSIRYKDDVQDMTLDHALAFVRGFRSVTYLSKCEGDDKQRRWPGGIAEEAESFADGRLYVSYSQDAAGNVIPESLSYDRMVVPINKTVQYLLDQLEALKDKVAALEAGNAQVQGSPLFIVTTQPVSEK